MKMAKLTDVARAAGVSRGTASNVFNNPAIVRPELRARVEAAAQALGYAGPDPKARLLRSGKFHAIGVVSPAEWGVADALANPVHGKFLRGVGEACDAVGANLVILPDKARDAGGGIRTALVDGFIFGRLEHLDKLKLAKLRRLPIVVVDVDSGPEISSVRVDARAGGHAAARHLLDLGHRRFAIMSVLRGAGPAKLFPAGTPRPPEAAGMPMDVEKLEGYGAALAEAGLAVDAVPLVQARPEDPAAAALLLDAAAGATAILSMTVMQAIAVMKEARRRGIRVPEELSVVGYNDIPEAEHASPPLTTVDALNIEKGRRAAEIVFTNGPPRHEVLAPRLTIRGSTGPAHR
jgi:DNA-binding LacI/PurR family transcriptional regulator